MKAHPFKIAGFFSLIISLIILTRFPTIFYHFHDWDEAELMSISWAMTQGQILYRDIPHFHPILHFFIFLPFFYLTSTNLAPHLIKIFNMVLILIGAILIARITWSWFKNQWICLAASLFFIFGLGYHEWAWSSYGEFYMLFPILLSLDIISSNQGYFTPVKAICTGFCLGVAFFIKQVALFDGIAVGLAFFLINKMRFSQKIKTAGYLFAGSVIAASVAFIYPFFHGTLMSTIHSTILITAVAYTKMDLVTSSSLLIRKIFLSCSDMINILSNELFLNQKWVMAAVSVLLAGGLVRFLFKRPKQENKLRIFFLLIFWFFFDLLGLSLIGRFFHHYLIELIPVISLLLALLLYHTPSFLKPISIAGLIMGFFFLCTHQFIKEIQTADWSKPKDVVRSERIAAFVRQHTHASDKIFINADKALDVYYLSERLSCNGIYMSKVMDSEHTNDSVLEKERRNIFVKNLPSLFL
ncbi:MAG: hypothetical protein JW774_09210, partial [Candidatus Aureabacteria bacterium]|nr:hypothetical protein [Candidatus Auribacterota bacterium]